MHEPYNICKIIHSCVALWLSIFDLIKKIGGSPCFCLLMKHTLTKYHVVVAHDINQYTVGVTNL